MSGKSIFVTVGSTSFHSLTALIISQPFLQLASSLHYHNIIVQHGSHTMGLQLPETSDVRLEAYDYKPSLQEDYERADLIISHAGKSKKSNIEERMLFLICKIIYYESLF